MSEIDEMLEFVFGAAEEMQGACHPSEMEPNRAYVREARAILADALGHLPVGILGAFVLKLRLAAEIRDEEIAVMTEEES